MMLALLLYAYAKGQRSSRVIERECVEDIAYRVIAANQRPDHCTIARFRQRHETALADLFGQVLELCAEAGLVKVGVIAIDGTKVHANASQHAARDYEQLAREILAEADAVIAKRTSFTGRLAAMSYRQSFRPTMAARAGCGKPSSALTPSAPRTPSRSRAHVPERLRESKRRLEEELATEQRANDAYEAYRARGVMKDGRRFGGGSKPYQPPPTPEGKVNVTDPDSRNVKTPRGYMQGYNAQAAATENQIVIAAEVTIASSDFGHLEPMVSATQTELAAAGVTRPSRGGRRGRRLLAPEANGGRDRPRHPGADPTRCRQTKRHSPRMGRRRLRTHATSARDRPRRRAVPKTQSDDRARVRQHEVQPADRPLPTPGKIGSTLRMAADHRHPQPLEAPQAPDSARRGLSDPCAQITALTRQHDPRRARHDSPRQRVSATREPALTGIRG